MFNALSTRPIVKSGFNTLVPKIIETKKKYFVLNRSYFETFNILGSAINNASSTTQFVVAIDTGTTSIDEWASIGTVSSFSLSGYKKAWIEWDCTFTSSTSGAYAIFRTGTSRWNGSLAGDGFIRRFNQAGSFTRRWDYFDLTGITSSSSYFFDVGVQTASPSNASNSIYCNFYNIYLEG